jgi:hypothetical protein
LGFLEEETNDAQKEGRMVGIGIGTTLDSGTNNFGQSQIVNLGHLLR